MNIECKKERANRNSERGERKRQLVVHLEGIITFRNTKNLLGALDSWLVENEKKRTIKRKVLNAYIELSDNLIHHNAKDTCGRPYPVSISVWACASSYIITTRNIGICRAIYQLKQRLIALNGMTNDAIRKKYLQRIIKGSDSKTGSGLGLMDISLRSKNKIGFGIQKFSENTSQIVMEVTINR